MFHLGRAALGERRRVETWEQLLSAAGFAVTPVALLGGFPVSRRTVGTVRDVLRHHATPESLAWNLQRALRVTSAPSVDLVVCITSRAFSPAFHETGAGVVLDLVDPLSVSYLERADHRGALEGRGLRWLSRMHARFEDVSQGVPIVVAGRTDAARLGVCWIPNVVTPGRVLTPHLDVWDVVFFGTLSYEPNIAAVDELASIVSRSERLRHCRVIIAGRGPGDRVRRTARDMGWELVEDFPSVEWLAARCRVAVAPLRIASGVQNKVLEAAACGIPQVISPQAAAGLDVGTPITVAADRDDFAVRLEALVDDDALRAQRARAERSHVVEQFSVSAWVPTVEKIVQGAMA